MPELTPEQQFTILKQKVSAYYHEVGQIHAEAKKAAGDPAAFPAFRGRYKGLKDTHEEFIKYWDELYALLLAQGKEGEFPFKDDNLTKARNAVYDCNTVYETIMNPLPSESTKKGDSNQSQDVSAGSLIRARYPKIQIPNFDGDIMKWPQFRDLFISLIHEEEGITRVEKFQHLISRLSGEPLQIVASFPLSDTNYPAAWKALNKRFDNKRVLGAAYMQRIRQFKPPYPQTSTLAHLRSFLKTVAENFSAIKALDIEHEADFLKLHMALENLDTETRQLYEEKQQGQEFPSYDSLIDFIHQRCQILELSEPRLTIGKSDRSLPSRPKVLTTFERKPMKPSSPSSSQLILDVCSLCKGKHPLFRCFSFRRLPVSEKMDIVKRHQLCFNCLRKGHSVSSCKSTRLCSQCQGKHHSGLHFSFKRDSSHHTQTPNSSPALTEGSSKTPPCSDGIVGAAAGRRTVLLGTAVANILDSNGRKHSMRIVIDSGSQFSIITEDFAKRIGLDVHPVNRSVSGIGLIQLPSVKGLVQCRIIPRQNEDLELKTKALVMPTITSNLPTISLDPMLQEYFNINRLADAEFWDSRPVDFLLGSDLFLQIILPHEPPNKISKSFGTLPTIFGHVVMGIPPLDAHLETSACLSITDSPVSDQILRDFWEIEEVAHPHCQHPEDARCEQHFKTNVTRSPCGRYMVALPFREPNKTFPTAKFQAMKRFISLEAKLSRNGELRTRYDEFIREYIDLGHMTSTSNNSEYTIPHHAVIQPATGPNLNAKFRVVFDASMKAPAESLNDNLLPGPKLQKDISSILLNFRAHKIAFCTDIVKMFRQILLREEDRVYQHIFWRFSSEEAITKYELTTVTYGLASSPYLALRVLLQLAEDEGNNFPKAARILRNDVYVDDVITGDSTVEGALELKHQIINILKTAGFAAHKWASNSGELLKSDERNMEPQISFSPKDSTTKVLGMLWNAEQDTLTYQVDITQPSITKRTILSVTARLYDPLGLLAPVIFVAKSILQQLWALKIGWDEALPPNITCAWTDFIHDLSSVKALQIPRWVSLPAKQMMLLGFCDASERGYAAVIFLRVITYTNKLHTYLLKAKTRLAPLKTQSIPRLELCAAQLLTSLLLSIKEFRERNQIDNILIFTDSSIVLSWLQMSPSNLKTFVSNRVAYILTHTELPQWHHVPSLENPADIASRGQNMSLILTNDLWWKGPPWMNINPLILPTQPPALKEIPERKDVAITLVANQDLNGLAHYMVDRYSTFRTIVRITAYVLRFCKHLRKGQERNFGPLSVLELNAASNYLIRENQLFYFKEDFDFDVSVSKSTRFKSLAVFQDQTGLLRVGGRLSLSNLPEATKHPIILPPQATFTALIIDHWHTQNFHLGPKALQANLQRQYYIFSIKSLIRRRIWKCMRCFRLRAKPENPLMADLPLSRVRQGRPFLSVGVDYAGPYNIKLSQRRNAPIMKSYLCVFICMAVKAVHLELVSSLSTEAFLAAFDRFVARRGLPTDIFSDCGTNFIGAARHWKELYEWHNSTSTKERISDYASLKGIQWHFNPPAAPHFGGLWEAAVKSAKSLLTKTLGDRVFYFEELITIFSRIEAILNSRPLCSISAQPLDYDYLTPGHFLIGSALICPPETNVSEENINRLNRWQLLRHAVQTFWRRWSNEYIHLLQPRTKWMDSTTPLKKDDLVLLQDSHTPPLKWRIGRIEMLHPGEDAIVRVATVKTATNTLTRPVHKLARLPQTDDGST